MTLIQRLLAGTAALGLMAVAPVALAHSQWLLPSATQVEASTNPQRPTYVTVDAASSNGLFYADHNAMRLTGLQISAPDGSLIEAENASTGKLRSTFDVKLEKEGTYRIASVSKSVIATYKAGEETKVFRGSEEDFAKQVPANAPELKIGRSYGRIETFVTSGKPSEIKPVGQGLELFPLQPTTDLVVGEKAKFRVLLDGKPVPGLKVKVVPGGVRFRGELGDQTVTADAEGTVAVDWKFGGQYYLNASYPPRPEADDDDHGPAQGGAQGGQRPQGAPQGQTSQGQASQGQGPQGQAGQGGMGGRMGVPRDLPPVSARYAVTVEVLPF
ncbi:DUF4198 domain-containing protein [Asticcacaulis sp. AND118]|uniref:DUF4198 domain-containing protein n=1 Tax=Asticcacaulis sp. AND118 TaxID=2840468 RepID=UPI001CFFCBAA|nr:DUF4198 domain-containing protein [Asticcacaulis sp. AND118]UDF05105.1 DUF4198 domain-containing protein [Asticcacaulis sp. AND118]